MMETAEHDLVRTGRGPALRFAVTGALSGTLATLAIFIPEWLGIYDALEGDVGAGAITLSFSPLSIGPGLVFGLLVGRTLARHGLATGARYWAYVAASTLSYFVTVQVTLNILVDMMDNIILVGILAGALGAALLAAATAALLTVFRCRRPIISMILAGAVFGACLYFPIAWEHSFGWLLLFAPWQGAFAAAMATVPEK
jgi:hypothetical protein